ncbi:MAG: hypothetical protein ACTSYF_12010 [Promethearchaeota archaeon]
MKILNQLEAYQQNQARERFFYIPLLAIVTLAICLPLEFLANKNTRTFTYLGSALFAIPIWAMIKETLYRRKKKQVTKLLLEQKYNELLEKLGQNFASHYVTDAFSHISDKNIMKQLTIIIKNNSNDEKRIHAAFALTKMHNHTLEIIKDIYEAFNTTNNEYLKFYIAWTIVLIEGKNGLAFNYIEEEYTNGNFLAFMDSESIDFFFELCNNEKLKETLNFEQINTQENSNESDKMEEVLAHQRLQTTKSNKKQNFLKRIPGDIVAGIIGYVIVRFIEFLITFLSNL